VKCYFDKHNIEPKALLLLDNAPDHHDNLDTSQTCLPAEVVHLSPSTTLLTQPMDQGVIRNVKATYLCSTFKYLIVKTGEDKQQSVRLCGKTTSFWMP
jgi:hypothetical protein